MNTEPVLGASIVSSIATVAGGLGISTQTNHDLLVAGVTAALVVIQNIAAFLARSNVSPVEKKIAEFISEEDWNRLIRGGDTATTA